MSMAAMEHVKEIRRINFSIGVEPTPVNVDHLLQPVEYLSAEPYMKDVHVLMDLIQIAEDKKYPEGVDPCLEFVITSKDITNTGAPATLLVFNNDEGFSKRSIDLLCTESGYLGEKGNGFKSVFHITPQPYIFSNDYRIMFNEKPCQHCNVSYIVPEWVENGPTLSDIKSIYDSAAPLPTTTLVLPIKPDKVKLVKDQLSSIHPEFLLFHEKLKRLSVAEDNEVPGLITVSPISIHREKVLTPSKRIDAGSYTVHLTTDNVDCECAYYMWEQRFQVKPENRVDDRMEVMVLTLAFPHEQRSKRDASLPGIYSSFLPTDIVTNFPFIIQADFILDSSRKSILWDKKWNQAILDCVPDTFLNAFTALVTSTPHAPVSSIRNMFWFLPVNKSSHLKLNDVRDAIKARLKNKKIVPYESYSKEERFCTPDEVRRLEPSFRSILNLVGSKDIHGGYILTPLFDIEEFTVILEFLEIRGLDCEWYAKCIKSCNLVMGVSEVVYIQLLVFIVESWGSWSDKTSMKNTPLIKYVSWDGKVDTLTLVSSADKLLVVDSNSSSDCISWLIDWNQEFRCSEGRYFLPKVTQEAIRSCSKKAMLMAWFKEEMDVKIVGVCKYAEFLSSLVSYDCNLVVTYAHFIYTSLENDYLCNHEVEVLCDNMPIVDNHQKVHIIKDGTILLDIFTRPNVSLCDDITLQNALNNGTHIFHKTVKVKAKKAIVVPANGSKWVGLYGTDPWREMDYVQLGEAYTHQVIYFCGDISGKELITFLGTYVGASDVPHVYPADVAIPTLSYSITKRNTFLLLDWIHKFKASWTTLPYKFQYSIKYKQWLRISSRGHSYHSTPSGVFMLDSPIANFLKNGLWHFSIRLIDEDFYGVKIRGYKEALQTIGVMTKDSEACQYIGEKFMSLPASSKFTRDSVLWILKFMEFLGKNHIFYGKFINIVKNEKCVRTSRGDNTPRDSVLFTHEWVTATQISNLPFINQTYYGEEALLCFKRQLGLLGVAMNVDKSYQLVLDNLKPPSTLTRLAPEAMLLLLRCISSLESSDMQVQAIKNIDCLMTNLGYRHPCECFLLNPEEFEWGCLLQVFTPIPILDDKFYGTSIFSMSSELRKIGVKVDFEEVMKEFTRTFKQHASQSSITKQHVLSFLRCYRNLKKLELKIPDEFTNYIRQEKWIMTRLGDYKSPNECILFGTDWERVISSNSMLLFIDDSNEFYGCEIHDFREELKELGVVTDFKDGAKFVSD